MEVAVWELKCEGVVACGSFSVKQLRCVGVTKKELFQKFTVVSKLNL